MFHENFQHLFQIPINYKRKYFHTLQHCSYAQETDITLKENISIQMYFFLPIYLEIG